MPTYDYVCNACEHGFEEFQPITAKPLRKCPQCGRLRLSRLIGTGAGFLFKGSGFYETDYRTESYQQGKAAESKSESTTESKPDQKAKPEQGSSGTTPLAKGKTEGKPPASSAKARGTSRGSRKGKS